MGDAVGNPKASVAPKGCGDTQIFADSGVSRHAWNGWALGELSVSSDRWSGGKDTTVTLTPLYVWRVARRAELLAGVPIGLTSSSNHVGAVIKFTFELGGVSE